MLNMLMPRPTRRVRDNGLVASIDRFARALAENVPGREREWATAVKDALGVLETALHQHLVTARVPDGIFAEVDDTRPTLARQTEELCQAYDKLLEQCSALLKETQRATEAFSSPPDPIGTTAPCTGRSCAAGVVDFGAIRQQGENLLASLRQNKDAETQLILESINTDIGVGD
jgi:hypothetical protein